MKKIIGLIFAAGIVLCGLSADSFAQSRYKTRSINNRESRQQRRIVNGVRTGKLTARETYRVERNQYRIRRQESRYRRSGNGLSWRERNRLQRELNQSSRRIYRQKHDKQSYRRRKL
ncbi:MAG: hypothetical protein ABJA66_05315 [Actinomycetota bacterium]